MQSTNLMLLCPYKLFKVVWWQFATLKYYFNWKVHSLRLNLNLNAKTLFLTCKKGLLGTSDKGKWCGLSFFKFVSFNSRHLNTFSKLRKCFSSHDVLYQKKNRISFCHHLGNLKAKIFDTISTVRVCFCSKPSLNKWAQQLHRWEQQCSPEMFPTQEKHVIFFAMSVL